MARLRRALLVICLLGSLPAFAQSADQEVVSVVDSPDPVAPGAVLSYTVTVRNNGPNAAVNGGLNINLPLAVASPSATAPAGWTCAFLGNNGTCNTPSFAAGTTEVITINATVGAHLANFPDQDISASFSPSGTTIDPNNGNNSKSATTTVNAPQIDLLVTASDSPDPVFVDGNLTYTVNVTNSGPDEASTVNFNVVPQSQLMFVSSNQPAGWNCTFPSVGAINATFTCSRPAYASGAADVFTVVFSANDEWFGINDTTITTYFGINGTGDDTNDPNNNTNVTTQYTTADADMSVAVTDSPDPVFPDGDITYTVTVANSGPDTAPNAVLNVYNNGSLRYQSATVPSGWNCTLPAADAFPQFQCTNPSFANGGNSVFTFVLRAYDEFNGIFDGTLYTAFSVGSSISDPDNPDNTETEATAYTTPDANVGVTATDAPDPVAAGNDITYTGSVTNAGPDAAPNVTLTIPLHSSLLLQSFTDPVGFSCTEPAVGTNGTITCTIASLPNGAILPFILVAQTNPTLNNGPDGIIQQGFLIGSSVADPTPANNSVLVDTQYTTPDADISVTNSASPIPVAPAGTVTFTQSITNNGPDMAVNATFFQAVPAGTTFQSFSAPAGWTCATPSVGGTGNITCSKASMTSGESGAFTLVVNVTAGSGTIGSEVAGDSDTYDPDPLDNEAEAATNIITPTTADLSITKTTAATTAPAGSTFSYTIAVTNNGPDAAANVQVVDTLPASLLFRSITEPAGFDCTTPAVGANGTITCTAATLANGASRSFTLVVEVAQGASGSIVNGVSSSSDTTDGNSGNSAVSSPGVVAGPAVADVSITKTTSSTTAIPGTNVTYTITVSNAGPSPATNVIVTDTLPAGLAFVSATPSQGSCNNASPVTCNLGTIGDDASATIALVAQVTATSGTISNSASVTSTEGGGDSDATPPIPVGSLPAVAPIPTLSEWALLGLALMLSAAAAVRMRG